MKRLEKKHPLSDLDRELSGEQLTTHGFTVRPVSEVPGFDEEILDIDHLFETAPGTPVKTYIGCDPGKNGGVVVMDTQGNIQKFTIPKIGDDVDIRAFYEIFIGIKGQSQHITVIIEDVHSIFGMSAKSNFEFGKICGVLEAIVIAHGFRFVKVAPKTWQNEIWLSSEKQYKTGPSGKKSTDTKLTSLKAVQRLFPGVDLRATERSKKPHDGLVDSLLLCEFGRRKNL